MQPLLSGLCVALACFAAALYGGTSFDLAWKGAIVAGTMCGALTWLLASIERRKAAKKVGLTISIPESELPDLWKTLAHSGKRDLNAMFDEMHAVYEQYARHRKNGKELFMRDPRNPRGPETRFVFKDEDAASPAAAAQATARRSNVIEFPRKRR